MLAMKGPHALSQSSGLKPERELEVALSRLLDEAREVGRTAGVAALEAGEYLEAPSSKPEPQELLAAVRRTLRQHQSPPERSLNQRMDALVRANEIRSLRAELKRDLKAGRRSIHSLLLDPPEFAETAKVADVLLAVPGLGRVGVSALLAASHIRPSTTIRGLSERKRTQLVSALRGSSPSHLDDDPQVDSH
jgi:hypothetical protein